MLAREIRPEDPEEAALWLEHRLTALRMPYRAHALHWLEFCTHCRLHEFQPGMGRFLQELNPRLRQQFVWNVAQVLEDAARYFGAEIHQTASPADSQGSQARSPR